MASHPGPSQVLAQALSIAPQSAHLADSPTPEAFSSLLNRILRGGPGLLLSLVPLKPVLGTNRRFQGFEIVRVHDNSPRILRYGVRPGDRLLKINGIAIVRPDDMMKLFSRLENASELVVEVRRDGQRRRVAIPIVPDKASTTSPQTP